MDENKVENKIVEIVNSYFGDRKDLTLNDKLAHILSESSQAIDFVSAIEEEFAIDLDDDEIDLDFFLDFNVLTSRVKRSLSNFC